MGNIYEQKDATLSSGRIYLDMVWFDWSVSDKPLTKRGFVYRLHYFPAVGRGTGRYSLSAVIGVFLSGLWPANRVPCNWRYKNQPRSGRWNQAVLVYDAAHSICLGHTYDRFHKDAPQYS